MFILDASALIALIYEEPGCDIVQQHLSGAMISAVNMTEVASYMIEKGVAASDTQQLLSELAIDIVPYGQEHLFLAAELRLKTRHKGLSLGDRACLALAMHTGAPILTADKIWKDLDIGIDIQLIR